MQTDCAPADMKQREGETQSRQTGDATDKKPQRQVWRGNETAFEETKPTKRKQRKADQTDRQIPNRQQESRADSGSEPTEKSVGRESRQKRSRERDLAQRQRRANTYSASTVCMIRESFGSNAALSFGSKSKLTNALFTSNSTCVQSTRLSTPAPLTCCCRATGPDRIR
eukprot:3323947-Rhodomonas_salina.1